MSSTCPFYVRFRELRAFFRFGLFVMKTFVMIRIDKTVSKSSNFLEFNELINLVYTFALFHHRPIYYYSASNSQCVDMKFQKSIATEQNTPLIIKFNVDIRKYHTFYVFVCCSGCLEAWNCFEQNIDSDISQEYGLFLACRRLADNGAVKTLLVIKKNVLRFFHLI